MIDDLIIFAFRDDNNYEKIKTLGKVYIFKSEKELLELYNNKNFEDIKDTTVLFYYSGNSKQQDSNLYLQFDPNDNENLLNIYDIINYSLHSICKRMYIMIKCNHKIERLARQFDKIDISLGLMSFSKNDICLIELKQNIEDLDFIKKDCFNFPLKLQANLGGDENCRPNCRFLVNTMLLYSKSKSEFSILKKEMVSKYDIISDSLSENNIMKNGNIIIKTILCKGKKPNIYRCKLFVCMEIDKIDKIEMYVLEITNELKRENIKNIYNGSFNVG